MLALPAGTRFAVAFPLHMSDEVTHDVVVENLRAQGFLRVALDGAVKHLDDLLTELVDITFAKEVAGGRRPARRGPRRGAAGWPRPWARRSSKARATASYSWPATVDAVADRRLRFTERFECPNDGTPAPAPTPQLFSFNSPRGACPTCNGFGAMLEYDEALDRPAPRAHAARRRDSIPWTKPRYDNKRRALAEFAKREKIPMDRPWRDLPPRHGTRCSTRACKGFKGIMPFLKDLEEKRYKQYIRVFLRQYQTAQTCPACHGTKLQPDALHVRVGGPQHRRR